MDIRDVLDLKELEQIIQVVKILLDHLDLMEHTLSTYMKKMELYIYYNVDLLQHIKIMK